MYNSNLMIETRVNISKILKRRSLTERNEIPKEFSINGKYLGGLIYS